MTALVFNNLVLAKTERSIVIRRVDRKDTPHLTIEFREISEEIDIHLKYESDKNDAASHYEPLTRIHIPSANAFLKNQIHAFEKEFVDIYWKLQRKIRPSVLRKKGYVIVTFDKNEFKSSFYAVAPKIRRKYRVDLEKLKHLVSTVNPSHFELHDPSILNTSKMRNYREELFAASSRGNRPLIPLRYGLRRNGKSAWLAFNGIENELPNILGKLFPSKKIEEFKEVWFRIHEALRLAEIGIER